MLLIACGGCLPCARYLSAHIRWLLCGRGIIACLCPCCPSAVRYGFQALAKNEYQGLSLYCTPQQQVQGVCAYTQGEQVSQLAASSLASRRGSRFLRAVRFAASRCW